MRRFLQSPLWMSAVMLACSLGTMKMRNDLLEFCTTRTYGFPIPWFADWCECERDAWAVQPIWVVINLAICLGLGSLAALVARMLSRTDLPHRAE